METEITNIVFDKVDSTNNLIKRFTVKKGEILTVAAGYQTGGYGQKGNKWESEEGKNLLFSMIFFADSIPASQQFLVSQAVSLSIREALVHYVPHEEKLTIKWPNDIYYEDKKICGFLVTCDIEENHLGRCTIGIGLNVNQESFSSDAPNPVSLKQITNHPHDITEVKLHILRCFRQYFSTLKDKRFSCIQRAYESHLYHRDGFHSYKDSNGTFLAEITHISPQGILTLQDKDGHTRHYAFKEVVQMPD